MLIDSRISEYTLLTFLHLHENRPGSEETLESKMLAATLGSFDQFLTMFGKCPFRGWHRRKSDMSIRLSKVSWHYLCEVHFEFSTLISVNWTGILDGIPHGEKCSRTQKSSVLLGKRNQFRSSCSIDLSHLCNTCPQHSSRPDSFQLWHKF